MKGRITWARTVAMVGWGGRGDDGGIMSKMDWIVVQYGWRASTSELGNGGGGARLCNYGRESERDRARAREGRE